MAINPIDLSTVYTQMDNVAKFNASQNQMAHVSNQQGIDKATRDNLEKSQAVKETAKDGPGTEASTIKKDGGNSSSGDGMMPAGKRQKKSEPEEEEKTVRFEISDPSLGQHIDITG